MEASEYQKELQELNDLYTKIERMSEAKAQEYMNSDDSKQTILMYIQEDMDEIREKLDELEQEDSCLGGYYVDEAFSSWKEFYAMVV